MKTVALKTLGCKVNIYESQAIKNQFIANDYKIVPFNSIADVYVINTCTVTNSADSKSRNFIRRAIRTNPKAIVAAVGCYTQVSAKEASEIEGLDIIIGNKNKLDVVKLVEQNKKFIHNDNVFSDYGFENLQVNDFTENTRAFLKIQDGCNEFCSYCKIPYARGKMRSRNKDDIIKSIQSFITNGYNEVVLTGVHTAGYGLDLEDYSFTQLLKDILENTKGLKRLRISSIEASYITNEIVEMIKNDSRMVKHLHIPIQSASNGVLKRMKRNYTINEFIKITDNLRKKIPEISLTTDIIVGFPQETDEEHQESLLNVKRIGFNELHVFPYSKRSGTAAALLKQLNGKVIDKRVKEMIDLSNQQAINYAKMFEGKIMNVLVESNNDNFSEGFTENYIRVRFKDEFGKKNEIKKVEITNGNFPISEGEIYETI